VGPSPDFVADPAKFTVNGGDGREGGDGPYVKPPMRGPHQGTVYVVDGDSGASGDNISLPLDHPAMIELHDPYANRDARGLDVAGTMLLEIDGGRLDASYVDFNGAVLDSFTITKGAVPPGAGGAAATTTGSNTTSSTGTGGAGGSGGGDGCSCRTAGRDEDQEWTLTVLAGAAFAGLLRRRRPSARVEPTCAPGRSSRGPKCSPSIRTSRECPPAEARLLPPTGLRAIASGAPRADRRA
jgi:MYXO-CTERM domain-containing protein